MGIRCRANTTFAAAGFSIARGEIVLVDAAGWAPYISKGWLTPIDPVGREENDGSIDTSGSDGWPDGPLVEHFPGGPTSSPDPRS